MDGGILLFRKDLQFEKAVWPISTRFFRVNWFQKDYNNHKMQIHQYFAVMLEVWWIIMMHTCRMHHLPILFRDSSVGSVGRWSQENPIFEKQPSGTCVIPCSMVRWVMPVPPFLGIVPPELFKNILVVYKRRRQKILATRQLAC